MNTMTGSARNDSPSHKANEKAKPERKPMRRDAEKRRQQNIQAQRRYRQKIRERLENLEALAATTHNTSPSDAGGTQTTRSDSTPDIPEMTTAPSSDCGSQFSAFNAMAAQDYLGDMLPWDASFWDLTGNLSHANISPPYLGIPGLNPVDSSPEPHMMLPEVFQDLESCHPGSPATTTVACACHRPHLQITSHRPSLDGSVEVTVLDIAVEAPEAIGTPDPYMNHIRLDNLCTLAAMDMLRLQVGLTEDMMCSDDVPSPFYRQIRATAHSNSRTKMVDAVQKSFQALHPDLRPCTEQITVPHPPHVDALPFQTLRRNLITRQNEVHSAEFLNDLLTGLVCWGGTALSKRDKDTATGLATTGTPWDCRSWEAKEWFLRKYWSLLGGSDGELVRQSEWWCSMRGEELAIGSIEIAAAA